MDIENHTLMANAIRTLSMDAVETARSGHPGMPMGTADIVTVLMTRFMKFNPADPKWPDRDRFVLSAGHGSMLLYSTLYLLGYEDMSLDELKQFRQLGAKTAGHPEYGHAGGIETTTGPLGQGLATAVGMALGERIMNAQFGNDVVDHNTYVLASDGDLMEGISHEAISLAGHYGLSKLIVLFDDNGISIDGALSLTESGDQLKRFEASGWHTTRIDGHDPAAIEQAIIDAKASNKPSLIACKTIIGYGAPTKAGTSSSHGAPLGEVELAGAKSALGWDADPFQVPDDILDAWRIAGLRNVPAYKSWHKRHEAMDSEERSELDRRLSGILPTRLSDAIDAYKKRLAEEQATMATRKASEAMLEVVNSVLPETIGGSADLTGSNNTITTGMVDITRDDYSGRYMRWGVREHGMAAAMNGLALHGGVLPYSGGFLIFSDYCRPSLRLAALMGLRVIHVFTHDSIGLGEDGPTHQPIEQLASLRAIPRLLDLRPCDVTETAECWQLALESNGRPSFLALTRQSLSSQRPDYIAENLCARGAYTIGDADEAEVVIFASGSEVEIAMEARALLSEKNILVRVVSVPSFALFNEQSDDYKQSVLGDERVRVGIEAAIRLGWDQFIGSNGLFIGMSDFGASGPYQAVYEHFGITAQAAVDAIEQAL